MSITTALIRYRATILLAVSLLLLGAIAGLGAAQLGQIISRQMRTDTVAAICGTFQHQAYDRLATMIDPTPVPPLAAGPFNPTTFQAQLHALDQQQGLVSGCAWRPLHVDDNGATYLFTLQRPRTPIPIGMMVVMRHAPDNGWRISRESPFTSKPV